MPRNGPLLALFAALWLRGPARADDKPMTPEQLRFFETSIRPLLVEHCQKCHGPQKQRADLRVDSREAILKGGESGPAAVSGKPGESLLLKAVRHLDPELKMPPEQKLSDRQIADLERWVRMGLPFPPNQAVKSAGRPEDHWAFKPPVDPPVPAVKDTRWATSTLDHFVLAKLEAKGLRPAAPADARTLIRRATFDLIGLPPTPEEVEAFVRGFAANPQAEYGRLIERLLASPQYGERWGRHWLDVARYADSNGLDENVAYGNAWRYRDYVVAALNRDLPYDEFLLEQLAGDLLDAPDDATRHRRLVATGFLALGPKVLAEVDERKMEMDIIDEQLDTVGRSLLGLTLGCARCHDHKFDPLEIKDYYGLAGVFKSTKTMEHFKKIARWHENPIATKAELDAKATHEQAVKREKDEIQKLVKSTAPEAQAELKSRREALAKLEKSAPEPPSAIGVTEAAVVDVPVHLRGDHLRLGKVVPRGVPRVLAGNEPPAFGPKSSGRLELARWLTRPDHPLTARVMVNRVWRWHFGHGIVRSTDNFGRLGDAPDNPELLDWLARRFVEEKWSVKALHRLIMLSSTYRMSATADPATLAADPDNRLHGRSEVRRLEAEAVRDALLAATGTLDPAAGGPVLHVKNREFLFDHTSKDTTKYDSRRRSIYLPVIRNNVYDVFQLFDYPDPAVPTGDRATTTVAPQALFLLNSEWAMRLCEDSAAALLKDASLDDAGRVRRIYARAYGREATAEEVAKGLDLVRDVEQALGERGRAWACLWQVVVSANEFVYVK